MKKIVLLLCIVFATTTISAQCPHCEKHAKTECQETNDKGCCTIDAQANADREWMESGAWSNGWGVKAHPSINATEFANQYRKNQEVWDAMFSYLASVDLDTIAAGTRVDIVPDGRCFIKVSEYEPKEADKVNIEQHHRAIDLQYTTSGNELMGYAQDVTVKNPYNEKKDVAHFNSDNVTYHKADASAFFLFFPSDYHQPSVKGEGPVETSRKIVCKIEYVD